MNSLSENNEKKLRVNAPNDSDSNIPGALLSVEIGVDEEVEWVWTHLENGKSAVTGYTIINKEGSTSQA